MSAAGPFASSTCACFEILGRSAIFKIEGVDEQGLTEEEKAGLLGEILSISERIFLPQPHLCRE